MTHIDRIAAQATAFALAAAVTLSLLLGVDHLAVSEHAAQDAPTLVKASDRALRS